MKTGTVVGRLWASKRLPELPAGALIEVQLDCPKDVIVCFDPLGCGEGERVLITIGAPAAWWFAPALRVLRDRERWLFIGALAGPNAQRSP